MSHHKESTASGTLAVLSHSIRLRPGAHTWAECVLRATYQERGNSREAVRREEGQTEWQTQKERAETWREIKSGRGERSRVRVKERRVTLESRREQRLRWQRGLL